MQPTPHTIQPGETLTSIATKHNQAGWQAIYFADCNREFRRQFPDPDMIRPGGIIQIPPSLAQQQMALQKRIQHLQNVKRSAEELFREQEKALDGDLQDIKSTAGTVDTVATVLTTIYGLGKLTQTAAKNMKLHGEALEAANKELLKDTVKGKAGQMRDLTATVVSAAKSESTNTVWILTKSVAQAWCDMTSPSFWANTFVQLHDQYQRGGVDETSWSEAVTTRPEDVYAEAKQRLVNTKIRALSDLDEKIREAQTELNNAR